LDTGFIKPIRQLIQRDKDKFNKKLLVFLFFLVVSTIFWFLSMLNKEYTTDLQYPVEYTNFPEDKVLVGELPSSLTLNVSGYGYTLLRYRLSRQLLPIIFDVNSFSLNRISDEEDTFFILTGVARNKISDQLAGIEINDIRPDTLFFQFTDVVSRKIPVKAELDLGFRQQYMQSGSVLIEPDSVVAAGPEPVIDTLEHARTNMLSLQDVDRTVEEHVSLSSYDYVSFSEEKVKITVPVEQFTESSIKIPIEAVNVPEELKLKTFPSEVTASFIVPLSDYDRVSQEQFRIYVDYDKLQQENVGRLPVELAAAPEFVRNVRYNPQMVDFIVEK